MITNGRNNYNRTSPRISVTTHERFWLWAFRFSEHSCTHFFLLSSKDRTGRPATHCARAPEITPPSSAANNTCVLHSILFTFHSAVLECRAYVIRFFLSHQNISLLSSLLLIVLLYFRPSCLSVSCPCVRKCNIICMFFDVPSKRSPSKPAPQPPSGDSWGEYRRYTYLGEANRVSSPYPPADHESRCI